MNSIEIGPSIIAADYMNMADSIAEIERGGADIIHVDVMDGHFVPNITIGPPVVESLRKITDKPLDCHLMIAEPDRWLQSFAQAGADRISIHAEAAPHLHRTVHAIREAGAKAGVALNPATPLSAVDELLADLDFVLIMSVNPGFSGQAFIEDSIDKVRRLHETIASRGLKTMIQVDGGVDQTNIDKLAAVGARSFVAGSSVFKSPSAAEAVRRLRSAAEAVV